MADADIFEGVKRNLIFNEVKFTPNGGSITVSAKSVSGKWVENFLSKTLIISFDMGELLIAKLGIKPGLMG